MQVTNRPMFVHFNPVHTGHIQIPQFEGAKKPNNKQAPKPVKISKKAEQQLKDIAAKYSQDFTRLLERARAIYRSMKGLETIKLTDEEIFKLVSDGVNPNGPRYHTMAMNEGGQKYTQALNEGGGWGGPPPQR